MPEGRWLRHIERTVRGSGDRCFASVRGAQSSAALGARSAIAFNFDPENETALHLPHLPHLAFYLLPLASCLLPFALLHRKHELFQQTLVIDQRLL